MSILKALGRFFPIYAAAMAICSASIANAQDDAVLPTTDDNVEVYWNAAFWTIFKNNSRQSCFIEWRSETTAVQAGLTKDLSSGYLGAFIKDFETVEGDRAVAILLNGNLYVGTSTTVTQTLSDGFKGGYVLVNNPRFVSDLEEASEFVAFPDSPNTITVTLKTPKNAIDRARECMGTF